MDDLHLLGGLHLRLGPDGDGHGGPDRDEAREGDARQRGQLHAQAAVHERLARVGGGEHGGLSGDEEAYAPHEHRRGPWAG